VQHFKCNIVIKPIISCELDSPCQVDLVDMQTCKNDGFKFILDYQDHLSKYIQFRLLKFKTAKEVAHNLLNIYFLFPVLQIFYILTTDESS
jgi:hypothetical protein